MRKLSLILLFVLLSISVSAQYPYHNPGIFYMPAPGPEKYFAENAGFDDSEDRSWARFQLQTAMVFNSFNGSNTVTSWLSPTVLVPVNSKFIIEFGGSFLNSFVPGDDPGISGNSGFIMHVKGLYSVNEKLLLYGEYSKSLLNDGMFGKDGFETMTLGMDYHLAPGMRIGVSLTTVKGINPYYNNRRQPYGYRLPYYY